RVVTPNIDILPGVTRGRVIEILGELGYTLEEREIRLEELLQADEVVITAANKQIVPIVQINEQPIGDGTVGEHAQTLMNAFRSYVARYAVARATVSES
ncbi:MAG: aminotransferase class IV, partial [Phototrophicaceae bacterium]